jgi:PKHD-type hydroxylase
MTWFLSSEFCTDTTESYAWANNVFTEEEIQKIIGIGADLEEVNGEIGNQKDNLKGEIRKAKVSWIHPEEGNEWLFRRLVDAIQDINGRFFNFDLLGMLEPLQFTTYHGNGAHYQKHVDRTMGKKARKLSIVVQLSDPEDYEGGNLELYVGHEPIIMEKKKGMISFFPSYVLHGVTPVTKGTRHSLVVWVHGPAFK